MAHDSGVCCASPRQHHRVGAAAHGSDACCASPLRHLKAGVATHSGGAAGRCCPYVGSGFSLKQRPLFLCGGVASAQGFLSTWSLEPTAIPGEVDRVVVSSPAPPKVLVLLQTGPRHQARGPLALAPRTSRRATALLHAPCSSIRAPNLVLRRDGSPDSAAASGRRAGFRWQTTTAGGLSHSKPKNSSHAT